MKARPGVVCVAIVLAASVSASCRSAAHEEKEVALVGATAAEGGVAGKHPAVCLQLRAAPAHEPREPWPPPGSGRTAPQRPAVDSKTIRLEPKEGGWKLDELLLFVTKTSGRSILFDSMNQTFRQAKIEFVGVHEIPESQLFDWLQAVLSYRKLVLVPVGPEGVAGQQWFVMDQADPALKTRPVWVEEADLASYKNRDGLYIVTTLRVRDTVDTTRARNALSPLSTAIAGIGRIMDVPGSHSLIVGDFAPVVWSMKEILDRINTLAKEPAPAEPPPAEAPK